MTLISGMMTLTTFLSLSKSNRYPRRPDGTTISAVCVWWHRRTLSYYLVDTSAYVLSAQPTWKPWESMENLMGSTIVRSVVFELPQGIASIMPNSQLLL